MTTKLKLSAPSKMPTPLYGLLLVGGESRRMGRDKALISYDQGATIQLDRSSHLLQHVCEQVFISQRREQDFPLPPSVRPIFDQVPDIYGPLCGILSAQQAHPNVDWLVLACDLPYITTETLEYLTTAYREQPGQLTAYQSSHDGLPEPLCAIYPAGSYQTLQTLSVEIGKSCPRKLLMLQAARLIEQQDPRSLDNINTLAEFQALTQC